MRYTHILGIDPSLTGTGVALVSLSGKEPKVERLLSIKSTPSASPYARIARYDAIVTKVMEALGGLTSPVIAASIEGYSFMARGSALSALPELGALLRYRLEQSHIPWCEFAPSSVKKFATGKGNAMKDLMLLNVQAKFGAMLTAGNFSLKDSNQGDALALAMMLVTYVQWKHFGMSLPKDYGEVIKKMDSDRFYQINQKVSAETFITQKLA